MNKTISNELHFSQLKSEQKKEFKRLVSGMLKGTAWMYADSWSDRRIILICAPHIKIDRFTRSILVSRVTNDLVGIAEKSIDPSCDSEEISTVISYLLEFLQRDPAFGIKFTGCHFKEEDISSAPFTPITQALLILGLKFLNHNQYFHFGDLILQWLSDNFSLSNPNVPSS